MCPHGVNLVMATAEGAIRLFKIDRKFAKPRVLEVTGKSRTSTLPAACTPAPQLRQQTAHSSIPCPPPPPTTTHATPSPHGSTPT